MKYLVFMWSCLNRFLARFFVLLVINSSVSFADYVCIDFFPEKEMILGTGEKIYPPSLPRFREFRVGVYSYPIQTSIRITSDKDVLFLDAKFTQKAKTLNIYEAKNYFNNVFAGGMVKSDGKDSFFFLLTKSELILLDGNGRIRVYSGEDVQRWILRIDNLKR